MMMIILIVIIIKQRMALKREEIGKMLCHLYGRKYFKHTKAMLVNAHILRRGLMKNYKPFHIERGTTCTINCSYRIVARLYPTNMSFSGT
jgi:hypothetical protein